MTTQLFFRHGAPVDQSQLALVRMGARGQSGILTRREACYRCGGRGGSDAWRYTGWTCYRCGGSGSEMRAHKVYTAEKLAQLIKAEEQRRAKKVAEADRKAERDRLDFIAWVKDGGHGATIGRILRTAKLSNIDFLTNIASRIRKQMPLSDKQVSVAIRVIDSMEKRVAEDAASEHVGDIKQRLEFEGEVVFSTERESYYGVTTIIKIKDEKGNLFTWFASGFHALVRGDRVKIRGTVKKHDMYNGVKQTIITRCAYEKFIVMTPDEAAEADLAAQ